MPIDPTHEKLLSLAEAARMLPKKPSPATLWRWHRKGVRGIRLETVVVGGQRYTTLAAFRDFVRKITAARKGEGDGNNEDESTRSPETEKRLRDSGLL